MNTFIKLSSDERNLYCRQAAEKLEYEFNDWVKSH